ncbi:MAG: alpha/beta hydrolase, partial [Marinicaulis sp.]|nr:alpha/beta hydrolase [Marinicaulis sp.]
MKKILLVLLAFIVIAAALFLLRTPDTDPEEMRAKYTNNASQFAASDDGKLVVHYRDQGVRSGIPIILLHGTASSLHTWEPLVALLGDEYRIISLTLPGHGLTGPHPDDDYTFEGMAQAVDLVVEKLRLPNFVLGGNSMGGWVTWRYALKYPERVDALVLLDAWGMPLREGEE